MTRWTALAIALCATATGLASTPARADITYTFSGTYTSDRDDEGNPTASQTAVFTFTVPDFLIGHFDISPSSCVTNDARFTCATTQRLESYPTGFGDGAVGDYIGLNLDTVDGSGTGFYFFQPGALGAVGTYTTEGWPNPGGPTSDGGFVGNAGFATLTVSGIVSAVPEPASWAMMIVGFGMAGVSLRARRRAGKPRPIALPARA